MIGDFEKHIQKEIMLLADITRDRVKEASLILQRSNDKRYRLHIYDKNGIDTDWVIGEQYEVKNVEIRSRSDGGRFLSDTKKTLLNRLTYDSFDFIVLGDTHFGYRNRKNHVDTRYINGYEFDVLNAIVEEAQRKEVDAILHTGDLLDEVINSYGYNKVKKKLNHLKKLNIYFSFVLGNHDEKIKDDLSELTKIKNVRRIDDENNWGSVSGFNIIGKNHNTLSELEDFDWIGFEEKHGGPNMLIAHPTDVPQERSVFEDLSEKLNKRWVMFLGHKHEKEEFCLPNMRIIFTGFPAKLDDQGSVWRVQGGNKKYKISRSRVRTLPF